MQRRDCGTGSIYAPTAAAAACVRLLGTPQADPLPIPTPCTIIFYHIDCDDHAPPMTRRKNARHDAAGVVNDQAGDPVSGRQ
jgi:hypothetical protein